VEGVLTAAGQLARMSEFRFDVWHSEDEHQYITVKRGRGRIPSGKWAIAAGESASGRFWNGEVWSFEIRGLDAYIWDLEEALVTAQRLAFKANQLKVDIMERRFPGEFRGGPYDHAARKET
jgi:hypothetical protein